MKRLVLVIALLAAAGGGIYWWQMRAPAVEQASLGAGGGRTRGGAGAPVPVLAARASNADVPIYLDGLGAVEAFNEAQIRSMIDGPLIEVGFQEGQNVKQGAVLARIDPRPAQAALDSALAKKRQDQASLQNAKLDADRYDKLAKTAYSSKQQADTARSQVAQLEAQILGDQAQIDTASTQLGYATIRAPFDGRVGLRQVDVGNIVRPGDAAPITVLTQLQPISVVFTLPQQELPAVVAAMKGEAPEVLAVAGAGADPSRVLDRGVLAVLDNQVDSATGTIKLKATFPNPDLALWPGGFVNVRLRANTERNVVTIPPAAVQRGPKGPYAFVIAPDMGVKRQPLEIGHEDQDIAIVAAGLAAGQQVVTDGAQRLDDKSKVVVVAPDGDAPAPVAPDRSAPDRSAPGGSPRSAPETAQSGERKAS